MKHRTTTFGVGRGVWVAPWLSENGEAIIVAVTRRGRLACAAVVVAAGASEEIVTEALWGYLDGHDPERVLALVR